MKKVGLGKLVLKNVNYISGVSTLQARTTLETFDLKPNPEAKVYFQAHMDARNQLKKTTFHRGKDIGSPHCVYPFLALGMLSEC